MNEDQAEIMIDLLRSIDKRLKEVEINLIQINTNSSNIEPTAYNLDDIHEVLSVLANSMSKR